MKRQGEVKLTETVVFGWNVYCINSYSRVLYYSFMNHDTLDCSVFSESKMIIKIKVISCYPCLRKYFHVLGVIRI